MTTQLEPREVFSIFAQINQVPRPSKQEGKIIAFMQQFAADHGIACTTDDAGNVIMRKPATPGYEGHPGIILQAHMDMVCEKNKDVEHDFLNDPIRTYVEGDWLHACGTTLGADDGIGLAMALAVLTSDTAQHPDLECLFTVDEETGLTGAFALGQGLLQGKRLINLDSEDDGQIFIGCAGGIDTLAKFDISCEATPGGMFSAIVSVRGLMGGHSGDDIEKGRGNANKILVRFLDRIDRLTDMRLAHIDGGNLRNAIAREAQATICVPITFKEQLRIELNQFAADIEGELGSVEKDLHIELESTETPESVLTKELTVRLIHALYACPHGVLAMSQDMPGLVETSTNLASIKMDSQHITVNTSQRSSVESAKHDAKRMVEYALSLGGAACTHGDGYPGWKPNTHTELLTLTVDAYRRLFGKEPVVRAIHAGLECGLFLEKYPWLDMVSIGPQMVGVHSPMERLNIPSTGRCYQWLLDILAHS